jgi:glutamate racemase
VKAAASRSASKLPIGIFDSGIGGLTVVRRIHEALPKEDLVYLGDTARVPYGTKSPETVIRFACEDAAFLLGQKVKAVVVACNTASAWALATLRREFAVPVFGVIEPGAMAALMQTENRRIGVIATRATVCSEAYRRCIQKWEPRARVVAQACPLLVPLVEEGWDRHLVTREVLREYLGPILGEGVDTLVLGCTHYPLLKPAIQKVAGRRIHLVDSAESCAQDVRLSLDRLALLTKRRRAGRIVPYVTDDTERFQAMAARFLGFTAERAHLVELTPYTAKSQQT